MVVIIMVMERYFLKRKKFTLVIALLVIVLSNAGNLKAQTCNTNVSLGQNLVVNGDFSLGETGFTFTAATNCSASLTNACPNGNGYRNGFVKCGSACYSSPGDLWVGDSSGYFNQAFNLGSSGFTHPIPDHSPTADNKFLMVDGSCTSGIDAWAQTLTLTANTNYYFETWVTNLSGQVPAATLQFVVNGNLTNPVLTSSSITVAATQGTWNLFTATFNSGTNTSATIRIQNTTTTGCASAVDFGIDDITLTPGCQFGAAGPQPNLGPDISICGTGGSLTLQSNVPQNSTTTVTWSTGATGTGLGAPYSLVVNAAGTYAVCVSDGGSCVKSDVIVVTPTYSVNIGSDFNLCNPGSQTLDAVFTGIGVTYQWQEFVSGAWTNLLSSIAQQRTYTVNLPGTYRVVVSEPTCGIVNSNQVVASTQQTATPNNVFFCPTSNVRLSVTGPGTYNWYAASSGGAALATATSSYIAPNLSVSTTFYVEDVTTYSTTVGKPTLNQASGNQGQLTDKAIVFAAGQPFTIDSVTVYWFMNNNNPNDPLNIQFILTNNPASSNTAATTLLTSAAWSSTNTLANAAHQVSPVFPTTGISVYAVRVPVNLAVPSSGTYRLGVASSTGNAWIQQGGGVSYPYNDAATSGSIVSMTSSKLGTNPITTTDYHGMFNWKISYKLNCARVPVIATPDCSLPVELLSFDGFESNNSVQLYWQTGTEKNSDYFKILRSDDGIRFYEIGTVKSVGNSSNSINYSYADNIGISGIVYYKLAQYDLNGEVHYSKTIAVKSEVGEVIVFPNPTDNSFEVKLSVHKDDEVRLVLLNQLSQVVYENTNNVASGLFSENITVENLASGTYFLQVYTSNHNWVKKIVKR
jgi:hypothetical protein